LELPQQSSHLFDDDDDFTIFDVSGYLNDDDFTIFDVSGYLNDDDFVIFDVNGYLNDDDFPIFYASGYFNGDDDDSNSHEGLNELFIHVLYPNSFLSSMIIINDGDFNCVHDANAHVFVRHFDTKIPLYFHFQLNFNYFNYFSKNSYDLHDFQMN